MLLLLCPLGIILPCLQHPVAFIFCFYFFLSRQNNSKAPKITQHTWALKHQCRSAEVGKTVTTVPGSCHSCRMAWCPQCSGHMDTWQEWTTCDGCHGSSGPAPTELHTHTQTPSTLILHRNVVLDRATHHPH